MSQDCPNYFAARAEEEIAAAQAAATPEAVRSHYYLAGHYLDLAFKDVPPETALAA